MSDVRLKVNVVADGKFYERNTVIDDAILPDHLKTEAHVSYDLEDAAGCVLLLHDLNFSTVAKPVSSGIPTSFPRQVMAGDLLDLKTVPGTQNVVSMARPGAKADP